jgi:hypothetical protein
MVSNHIYVSIPIFSGLVVINTCRPAVGYFLTEVWFVANQFGMCFLISAAISVGVKLIAAKL